MNKETNRRLKILLWNLPGINSFLAFGLFYKVTRAIQTTFFFRGGGWWWLIRLNSLQTIVCL